MKSIRETLLKIKQIDTSTLSDLYVVTLILFVGLSSFGLGRLSVESNTKDPIEIITINSAAAYDSTGDGASIDAQADQGGQLVASKNGTKYHYPWCSGAQRMKEENKIWFDSMEDARKAGYTPAANCKGLK